MQTQPTLTDIYDGLKYWGPIITFLGLVTKGVFSVVKGMNSITTIKDNHLPHLQESMNHQTEELKELREDFRAYFRRD